MESIRLERIEITNFKNVRYGVIDLPPDHKSNSACSMLGLYGQNGSGKTAMIDSLQILKYLLSSFVCCSSDDVSGWGDCINVEAASAELAWTFRIVEETGVEHSVEYSVTLRKSSDSGDVAKVLQPSRLEFRNERISVASTANGVKVRKKTPLVDAGGDEIIKPMSVLRSLFASDKTIKEDLIVAKKLARERGRSFLFSEEFAGVLSKSRAGGCDLLSKVIFRLRYYGQFELFVVNTSAIGLICHNALPISFTYEKSTGSILLPLNDDMVVHQKVFDTAQVLIQHMNVVLCQLVPGLTIALKNIGSQLLPDGSTGIRVQFVSLKNKQEIPLKYESEGIKKIISVMHLLIEVYNNKSTTVAIDELDSGVFEYLLGELLRIIANQGQGQLIFTSHNLRPLETLRRECIAFTSTNPDKRYIRFRNVKTNNNLRNFYYRDILLGGQSEDVYNRTNNSEISFAFMSAGAMIRETMKGDARVS